MNKMDMGGMDMGGGSTKNDTTSMDMSNSSMPMNKYFVNGYDNYPVMFKSLTASSGAAAFGIFCVLFFGGFFLRGLSFLSLYLEIKVFKTQSTNIDITIEEEDNCACDDLDGSSNEKGSDTGNITKTVAAGGIVTASTSKPGAVIRKARVSNAASHDFGKQRSVIGQLFAPGWGEIYKDLIRVCLYFVTAMFSYALMIAAMSYIVLYFFALCLGVAFGELFFNRLRVVLELNNNLSGVCGNLH